MKNKTRIILAFILGLGLGLIVSYSAGFAMGIKWTVATGYAFLEEKGVDISLTAEQISDLILTYKSEFETIKGSHHTRGEEIVNQNNTFLNSIILGII